MGSATIFFVSSVGRASGSPTCRGVQLEAPPSSLSAAWAELVAAPPAEVCSGKRHHLLRLQQRGQTVAAPPAEVCSGKRHHLLRQQRGQTVAAPPAELCSGKRRRLFMSKVCRAGNPLARCESLTAGSGAQMMPPSSLQQQGVACRDTPAGCQSLTTCSSAQMMPPSSPQQQGVACRDKPAGCKSLTNCSCAQMMPPSSPKQQCVACRDIQQGESPSHHLTWCANDATIASSVAVCGVKGHPAGCESLTPPAVVRK